MSRLLIIDSHAIVHRAYHSIPKLSHNGQVVNAVYGFYSMLLSAVAQLHPKYVIICSDSPGPNFRNAEFIGYRAKRAIPDRELISQFPILDQSLARANLPVFAVGGYEADDLIATVTRQSLTKRRQSDKKPLVDHIYIITGDKDIMQLVTPQIELFMPIRGLSEVKIIGPEGVKEKLGVNPDQVVDLKALIGDNSDNYPGIPGVGPVTAIDLLAKYQTLDNIYTHLDKIPQALREKLISNKEEAYLSQKLAQLVSDVPFIKFKLKDAVWTKDRLNNLADVFTSFGFKSLVSRINKQFGLKTNISAIIKNKVDSNQQQLF